MQEIPQQHEKQLIVLLEAMKAIERLGGNAGIAGRWAQKGDGKRLIQPLLNEKLICANTLKFCGVISLTNKGLRVARETFTYAYEDMPRSGQITYQNQKGENVLVVTM